MTTTNQFPFVTECARSEFFFYKFPDHKNATFEETDADQKEDQWENDIAPWKGLVPHAVRGVGATQEGKRSSTWDIDWRKRLTKTNEQLIGTRTDRVMCFGKEGMITLNVVTIMRRICAEVESVLDYDFTDR